MFRRHNLRALAMLLLIAATLSLQAAAFSPDHSSDHLTHCCALCHVAHLALINPYQALGVMALIVSEWRLAVPESSGYLETLVALGHSRAPPA